MKFLTHHRKGAQLFPDHALLLQPPAGAAPPCTREQGHAELAGGGPADGKSVGQVWEKCGWCEDVVHGSLELISARALSVKLN